MKTFISALVLISLSLSAHAQWKYKTEKDQMIDEATYLATLPSSNKVNLAFPYAGGTTGKLIARREAKKDGEVINVLFAVDKGQILKSEEFLVRFDDGAPISFELSGTASGSSNAVFLEFPAKIAKCEPQPVDKVQGETWSDHRNREVAAREACEITEAKFIDMLTKSAKVRVSATFYSQGAKVFEFRSAGLKL